MSTEKPAIERIRFDLQIIESWIEPGSSVLDLGCGEGDLLHYLTHHKSVSGTGIERNESKVVRCIEKGLSVIQGDINEEIGDYPDNRFDYVVLSQTLQQVYDPSTLLHAMLRVGARGIVSFPNFNHWRIRLQVLLTGRAPVTRTLPYQWYDTPNIRVLSLKDFYHYSREIGFDIITQVAISDPEQRRNGRFVRTMPNLFATYGIFMIGNSRKHKRA